VKSSCTNNTPPGFVGHWREWHRGHGCDRDDGKPRSDAAKTEIAQMDANKTTGFLTDAELDHLRAATTSGDTLRLRAIEELRFRRTESAWLEAALDEALDLFEMSWCPEHGHAPRPETHARAETLRKLLPKSKRRSPFDHSHRTAKAFQPLLGYCVCPHCTKLPEHAASLEEW